MRLIAVGLCFVLTLVISPAVSAENTKIRVLFVGNSLTYANDLPRLVADLSKAGSHDMEYESYAPGGYRLDQHAEDPKLSEKVRRGTWDFVILQEQSQWPALPLERVQKEVYPYAQTLCGMIRKANPRARIVFYMTMAKKNGDSLLSKTVPEAGTYAGMQARIDAAYSVMASQNDALLAPVGRVWQKVRLMDPSLELYADETHPNLTGSYLAACVFYAVLFKSSSLGLPHPAGISDKVASFLQKTTDEVLLRGGGALS